MYNLSRTGPKVDFIAFGRAFLGPVALLLGVFFSPVNVLAACVDELLTSPAGQSLLAQTKFVNIKNLATIPKSKLKAQIPEFEELKNALTVRLNEVVQKRTSLLANIPQRSLTVQIEKDLGIPALNEQMNALEEDIRGVGRYIAMLGRISQAAYSPSTISFPFLKIPVAGKTDVEAMHAIAKSVESLGKEKSKLILRFIPVARQDILFEHGIENFGRTFDSGNAWDMFGLEGILQERGLQAYDGFYALSLDNAETIGGTFNGITRPFEMVKNFVRGDRALAIYDADQLEEGDGDFFIFKSPEQRKKALIAFVLPVNR